MTYAEFCPYRASFHRSTNFFEHSLNQVREIGSSSNTFIDGIPLLFHHFSPNSLKNALKSSPYPQPISRFKRALIWVQEFN